MAPTLLLKNVGHSNIAALLRMTDVNQSAIDYEQIKNNLAHCFKPKTFIYSVSKVANMQMTEPLFRI